MSCQSQFYCARLGFKHVGAKKTLPWSDESRNKRWKLSSSLTFSNITCKWDKKGWGFPFIVLNGS